MAQDTRKPLWAIASLLLIRSSRWFGRWPRGTEASLANWNKVSYADAKETPQKAEKARKMRDVDQKRNRKRLLR